MLKLSFERYASIYSGARVFIDGRTPNSCKRPFATTHEINLSAETAKARPADPRSKVFFPRPRLRDTTSNGDVRSEGKYRGVTGRGARRYEPSFQAPQPCQAIRPLKPIPQEVGRHILVSPMFTG